jgi:hypothetical protein
MPDAGRPALTMTQDELGRPPPPGTNGGHPFFTLSAAGVRPYGATVNDAASVYSSDRGA